MNSPALPPELRWVGFDIDDTLHYFKRAALGQLLDQISR